MSRSNLKSLLPTCLMGLMLVVLSPWSSARSHDAPHEEPPSSAWPTWTTPLRESLAKTELAAASVRRAMLEFEAAQAKGDDAKKTLAALERKVHAVGAPGATSVLGQLHRRAFVQASPAGDAIRQLAWGLIAGAHADAGLLEAHDLCDGVAERDWVRVHALFERGGDGLSREQAVLLMSLSDFVLNDPTLTFGGSHCRAAVRRMSYVCYLCHAMGWAPQAAMDLLVAWADSRSSLVRSEAISQLKTIPCAATLDALLSRVARERVPGGFWGKEGKKPPAEIGHAKRAFIQARDELVAWGLPVEKISPAMSTKGRAAYTHGLHGQLLELRRKFDAAWARREVTIGVGRVGDEVVAQAAGSDLEFRVRLDGSSDDVAVDGRLYAGAEKIAAYQRKGVMHNPGIIVHTHHGDRGMRVILVFTLLQNGSYRYSITMVRM